jgi:hypothetical protein
MDELNGRMLACQILVAALIARVANDSRDPLRFLTEYRDEVRAVIGGIAIAGHPDVERVRRAAHAAADELFSLMKAPGDGSAER